MALTFSSLNRSIHEQKRKVIVRVDEKATLNRLLMPYFMGHQVEWMQDRTPIIQCVKGRRTGISYAESARAVMDCVADLYDTYYSTYSLDATRSFIKNSKKFATIANVAATAITQTLIIDNEEIQTQSLQFKNGRVIQAIPGNAVNLRDRQGVIVIDEAAFRKDLQEVLDAGYANLIWGGQLRVISTHFGVKNDFNRLAEDLAKNPEKGRLHFVPFQTALDNGLYKRICALKGEEWSQEGQDEWKRLLYLKAGQSALQEFDAIPMNYSSDSVFPKEAWKEVEFNRNDLRTCLKIRSFDMANTDKEIAKSTHYYTATILFACDAYNRLVVVDWEAKQVSNEKGDDWIEALSYQDGPNTIYLFELEGGSEASKYLSYMKRRLEHVQVKESKPQKNKLLRALPVAQMICSGDVVLAADLKDKQELIDYLDQFTGEKVPLITDLADSLSQGSIYWQEKIQRYL